MCRVPGVSRSRFQAWRRAAPERAARTARRAAPIKVSATAAPHAARLDGCLKHHGIRSSMPRNRAGVTSSRPDRFPILLHLTDPGHPAAAASPLSLHQWRSNGDRHVPAGLITRPIRGRMRRRMTAIAPGPAERLRAHAPQRRLGLFRRGLGHWRGVPRRRAASCSRLNLCATVSDVVTMSQF